MSYYGGTVTSAGRNLITGLIAGETIDFTRIVVGSGALPEDIEPIDVTKLIKPVAEATSTVPINENGVLSMTIEYRNDLNGGLQEGFWLREFGIFAKTENTEEILLYYATLGDSPQPVNAYQDNRIDIRRYPVTIALELEDEDVQVTYNPGSFVTAQEAKNLIDASVKDRLKIALEDFGNSFILEITIPSAEWTKQEETVETEEFPYYIDVSLPSASSEQFPAVALHKSSLAIAAYAKLCPTVQSLDGALRFWAARIPSEDMKATVALLTKSGNGSGGGGGGNYVLPIASETKLGGVKIGDGIEVTDDGTISSSGKISDEYVATDEEFNEMLDDVFNETN